jgi:ditrans,polycis-polyprenyl diphosphate synthase
MLEDAGDGSASMGDILLSAWTQAGPPRSPVLQRLLELPALTRSRRESLDALAAWAALPNLLAGTAIVSLALLLFVVAVARAVAHAAASPALARRVLRALRLGGTPSSVAFIMDGNRRWARARGRPAYDGHPRGGEKLAETLQWCLDAGIRTVTVYAFSIENFKRPQREIDEIFALAHERVSHMLEKADDVVQLHRVRVNVLGDLGLLPPHLRKVFARAMRDTRHFAGGPVLNICFAYTSRAEMARAISTAVCLCDRDLIVPNDINGHFIGSCLYTGYASGAHDSAYSLQHPELVVRTSGETRLSDFLLLQSGHSVISFQSVLWPDLTAWDMVRIILDYQSQRRSRILSEQRCTSVVDLTMAGQYLDQSASKLQADSLVTGSMANALGIARSEYFAQVDQIASSS